MGRFYDHFGIFEEVIGYNNPERHAFAMNALISNKGNFFIADTYINEDPDAEQLAKGTLMCANEIKRFGIKPKVALSRIPIMVHATIKTRSKCSWHWR